MKSLEVQVAASISQVMKRCIKFANICVSGDTKWHKAHIPPRAFLRGLNTISSRTCTSRRGLCHLLSTRLNLITTHTHHDLTSLPLAPARTLHTSRKQHGLHVHQYKTWTDDQNGASRPEQPPTRHTREHNGQRTPLPDHDPRLELTNY